MKEVLISSMSDIILDIVCGTLEHELNTLKERKKAATVKRDVYNSIKRMMLNHDGTILTSQELSEYLKNYKVIEKIFDTVWCAGYNVCGENELIEELINQCKSVIKEKGKHIPSGEEGLIREFFISIITILTRAAQQESTPGEHVLQMQLKDISNQINTFNGFIQVKDLLGKLTLLSVEDENSVFNAVYSWFCKGDFQEVQEIVPLLEGKSSNIKFALEVLLMLVMSDGYEPKQVAKLISKIDNEYIKDICAGFIIVYGFIWPEVITELSRKLNNATLVKVAENLYNKKWEEIIQIDNSTDQPSMSIVANIDYPHNKWFKARVIFWYLNEEKDRLPVQINEESWDTPIFMLDDWLLAKEKASFFFRTAEQKETLAQMRDKLLRQKGIANMVCAKIKALYWKTLFEICRKIEDTDTILKMWPQIPVYIQAERKVKEALFYAEILNKSVDEKKLIRFCISIEDPSLLVLYCLDKSDEKIIALYDQCGSFFDLDYHFFEMYIKARMRSAPRGDEKSVIESRKDDFQKWLDYWIFCEKQNINIDFKAIAEKICSAELIMNAHSVIYFGHILLSHNYLVEAERINEKHKAALFSEREYQLFRARILLSQGNQIEALTVLQSIEEEYQNVAFVIESILQLSIIHKRPISKNLITNAKRIDTLQGWYLLAHYYAEKNNAKLAMNAVTKALLRAKPEDAFVYGLYLELHSKFCNKKFEKIETVRENTCVLLHNPETKEDTAICIYADQVLPKGETTSFHKWEGAIHMVNEEAVKKGLCFQGIGDDVVVDKTTYVVESIKPVDAFLYNKAIEKCVESKSITLLTIPQQENGEIDLTEFISTIKKYMPEREDPLSKYKNPDGVPAPLFLLSQSRNMTYGQFVDVLFHDPSIVLRSIHSANSTQPHDYQYVLSFSVAILLFGMDLDFKVLEKDNVCVPSSMKETLIRESSVIQLEKSQDIVASIYFEDERPIVREETNATKRHFVQEALKFKTKCDKLNIAENTLSFSINGTREIELKEILGVCDYDAISLAFHQGKTLVAFEPFLVALSTKQNLGFRCIGVVDWLCETNAPLDVVLKTLYHLAEYRFEDLLSEMNWEYLTNKIEQTKDDEYREMCRNLWIKFLRKGDEFEPNDEYKIVFRQSVLISLKDFLAKSEKSGKTDIIVNNPLVLDCCRFLLARMMSEWQNDM